MSITNYIKTCEKVIPGSGDKLFLAKLSNLDKITVVANECTVIDMNSTDKFAYIQADLDSVSFTSSGTAEKGYFSEQALMAKFSKKTDALETMIEEFIDGVTCGIVAIRTDSNGKGWISGIAPLSKMAANRPYLSVSEEFASGESIEDVDDGNTYTITFGRKSATREFEIHEDMVDSLVKTKDATFVDWPA